MVRRFHDLVELGEESCRAFRDRALFGTKHAGGWTWTTYGEFAELVDAFRGGLASLGVRSGDRVAIVSKNCVEWAVAAYATYGLGATFVPMYEAQRADEWSFILGDSQSKVVVARTRAVASTLAKMRLELPHLGHVIGVEGGGDGVLAYEEILERGRSSPVRSARPDPESVAGFVYTSGTTGKPKGAMLTHANLTSNIAATTSYFPISMNDRSLSFLPWAHVYGQVVELHMLVSIGASTAFNSDVSKLLDELGEVRPTMLVAVPRIFNRIYANVNREMATKPRFVQALFRRGIEGSKRRRRGEALGPLASMDLALADRLIFSKIRKKFGGRLAYTISASAALSKDVAEFIDALGLDVYEGYGLTETSPVVSANRPGERRLGSVGKPIPGVTVEIDTSVGDEPNRGEIVVRGPNVMKGYHDRPDEDRKTLTPDGALRTGDIGYVDPEGFLFVTGRIKEQYKLENGKYVMPTPLEEKLKLSPYFANVMIYGDNRPFNTAIVVLVEAPVRAWAAERNVTLGADWGADPEVRRLVKEEIQRLGAEFRSFEVPRAFVTTREDFSIENGLLTPTLKLKRRAVLDRYKAEIDAIYAKEKPAPVSARV